MKASEGKIGRVLFTLTPVSSTGQALTSPIEGEENVGNIWVARRRYEN